MYGYICICMYVLACSPHAKMPPPHARHLPRCRRRMLAACQDAAAACSPLGMRRRMLASDCDACLSPLKP